MYLLQPCNEITRNYLEININHVSSVPIDIFWVVGLKDHKMYKSQDCFISLWSTHITQEGRVYYSDPLKTEMAWHD